MEGTRDPKSAIREAESWREVLRVTEELLGDISAASSVIVGVPLNMLTLLVGIGLVDAPPPTPGDAEAASEAVSRGTTEALKALLRMQDRIESIGRLAEGRAVALRDELGLPPTEGEPS